MIGRVPQDDKDALIQRLSKNKCNRYLCDNHRRISLQSMAGKIARLILNRISKHVVNEIYPVPQCGFRSGRGTIDMIFSLRLVSKKVREKNQVLYTVFVNVRPPIVNLESLWKVFKKLWIESGIKLDTKIEQPF